MVDFGSGPVKEHIDNTVFIVPAIIIVALVGAVMGDSAENVTETPTPRGPPAKHDINSFLFVGFLALVGSVLAFFAYKLVASLRQKHKLKEEKKKQKLHKREKETQRKQKKK